MATYSSILVKIIPWTEDPGRLQLPHNIEQSESSLVIHFKYSSVYMLIPNFLTIPSPILRPGDHKVLTEDCHSVWQSLGPSVLLQMVSFYPF